MTEQREFVTYLNGEVMPHSQAAYRLQQSGTQNAGGFYDAERTFGGRIFRLRQHLQRMYNGLDYSGIDPGINIDQMHDLTMELLEANRGMISDSGEVTVTQVVNVAQTDPPTENPVVNVLIYFQPLNLATFARSYSQGVRVVTPATYGMPEQSSEAGVKAGSQQIYPLMTSREGSITECRGANFMFVRDGRIKLPDRSNVLPGVSMQTVLELADSLAIAVDEDDYSAYDIYVAQEAFVSSTRYCMLPVASINGYLIGEGVPGEITLRLLDAWRELVGIDFVQQALDALPPTP